MILLLCGTTAGAHQTMLEAHFVTLSIINIKCHKIVRIVVVFYALLPPATIYVAINNSNNTRLSVTACNCFDCFTCKPCCEHQTDVIIFTIPSKSHRFELRIERLADRLRKSHASQSNQIDFHRLTLFTLHFITLLNLCSYRSKFLCVPKTGAENWHE